MDFSLFYFADDSAEDGAGGSAHGGSADGYRLLLEGARFADTHGFSAVWTPERHFHSFGGKYPNPAVTGAAVAAVTTRVGVRAGSVVAPLHHPLRIAEEWAVVDRLSGGRAGLSIASGWHPRDFVLRPEAYASRRSAARDAVEQLRALWRGEPADGVDGTGETVAVCSYPSPVRGSLPLWLTSSGTPATFELAAELGVGVLTHLLGQDLDALADNLRTYRTGMRDRHGRDGHSVLMLHTFVGADDDQVRDAVGEPFRRYLRSSFSLFARAITDDPDFDPDDIDPEDVDFLIDRSYERFYTTAGLFGTPETARPMVDRLAALELDEIACLVDFGVPTDQVLDGLTYLDRLRRDVQR